MFTESTTEIDLLFDNWRQNFRDKILYDDKKPTPAGEVHRIMLWELGSFRFHAVYTEVSPNRCVYKLTVQPFFENLYLESKMQEQPDNDIICDYLRNLRKNNW